MRIRLTRHPFEKEPDPRPEPEGCSPWLILAMLVLALLASLADLRGPLAALDIWRAPEHPAPPHLLYGLLALLLPALSQLGRGVFRRMLPVWIVVLTFLVLTAWISRYVTKDLEDTLAIMANVVTIVGVSGVVIEVYAWMAEHRHRAVEIRRLLRWISELDRRLAELEIGQAGASPGDGSEGSSAPRDTQAPESQPP